MVNQANPAITLARACLIIALGLVIYVNSLEGEFIWDDYGLIKNNTYLKGHKSIANFFTQGMGVGSQVESNFYRPLQMSINALNYSLWGLSKKGFHLTSVGLHIIVGLCIFWLVSILFSDDLLAFLTAVLFIVHPVHTEAIDYISGMSEPLSSSFILLSLIFYAKSVCLGNLKLFPLALFNFIFALLAKENSIILPLLIPLIHYILKKRIKISYFLPFVAALVLYVTLRVQIVRLAYSPDISFAGLFGRALNFFAAIAEYFRILLLPLHLRFQYNNAAFDFFDYRVLIGLAILSAVVITAFLRRKKDRLVFFSVFWFFICLLPVSNILGISYSYMMEHWLYLPSFGFFLFFAGTALHFLRSANSKISISIAIAGLLMFWSGLTIKQNNYWRDPITLFKRALRYDPDNWLFYNQLALAYEERGSSLEAIEACKKALIMNQNASGLYYNASRLYQSLGDKGEALALYKKGKEIDAESSRRYYEAGDKYLEAGKTAEAIVSYDKALKLNPGNLLIGINLGNAYIIEGKYKEAVILLKKALETVPDLAVGYNNLALAYYYDRQYDLAVKNCDKAIELGYKVKPDFFNSLKPYRK